MTSRSTPLSRRDSLTDAVLQIIAERGLDAVSVREVASAEGVSIGTVQHHFPTKDGMLAAAFQEVVARIRGRIGRIPLGPDVRTNLSRVLRELLPLSVERATEARVYLAFSARAATAPDLARIQRTVLEELHGSLTEAFVVAWGDGASPGRCRAAARAVIALADGLALHGVSAGTWSGPRHQREALDLVLDLLLDPR